METPKQTRADELVEFIRQTGEKLFEAQLELKKFREENALEDSRKWLGRCFRVDENVSENEGRFGNLYGRRIAFYQIVRFCHWYEATMIEYWPDDKILNVTSSGVGPHWLMENGHELSPTEYNEDVEALLKQTIPFCIGMPPRPSIETHCPCPGCIRCCCHWADQLVESECVNFDEFGRCTCKREISEEGAS